jgi:hypothetical protein
MIFTAFILHLIKNGKNLRLIFYDYRHPIAIWHGVVCVNDVHIKVNEMIISCMIFILEIFLFFC